MNIRDVYERMKVAIDQAAATKQYDVPIRFAEANGFMVRETSNTNLAFECTYVSEGGAIRLIYRSYDPSGPFQNLPDRNRYYLTLFEPSDRYHVDYDD